MIIAGWEGGKDLRLEGLDEVREHRTRSSWCPCPGRLGGRWGLGPIRHRRPLDQTGKFLRVGTEVLRGPRAGWGGDES